MAASQGSHSLRYLCAYQGLRISTSFMVTTAGTEGAAALLWCSGVSRHGAHLGPGGWVVDRSHPSWRWSPCPPEGGEEEGAVPSGLAGCTLPPAFIPGGHAVCPDSSTEQIFPITRQVWMNLGSLRWVFPGRQLDARLLCDFSRHTERFSHKWFLIVSSLA